MLSKRRILTLLPAVILALVGWYWLRNGFEVDEPNSVDSTTTEEKLVTQTDPASDSNLTQVDRVDQLVTQLLGSLELLKQVHGEARGQAVIEEMFQTLEASSAEDASRAIVRLLNTRQNALAFGRFAPGEDGFLSAYPSFRTALLDQLEKLDPAEAVDMGKSILADSENVDEWAISLRILSRHAQSIDDQNFLRGKVQELLHKDAWLEDPTFGFLHAFDAAVDGGALASIQRMEELLESEHDRAVTHAATISLDRLFQTHTQVGVEYLTNHPDFLNKAKGLRASLVARIDPADTNGIQLAEAYLGDPSFSVEEKQTFFQLFPNFNTTYSYNLITESKVPTRTDMRQASIAAFTELSVWSTENRYPEFQDDIDRAINRLAKAWKLEL